MHFPQLLLTFMHLFITSWAMVKANEANSSAEALKLRGLNRYEAAVEKRAACNHDNVLRALIANGIAATSFCTTYLGVVTTTVYVPGTTPTTTSVTPTFTTAVTSIPPAYSPYILPIYLFSYQTPSRISSACSCLSIPPLTITSTGQPTIAITSTTTITLSGPCATETLYPGAYKLSSPASNAYEYNVGLSSPEQRVYPDLSVLSCCALCNSFSPYRGSTGPGVEGLFGDCLGWRVDANRACTLLLQGPVGAGYLGTLCNVAGFQPATLTVNAGKYPLAVGGQGQCANPFTVMQS